MHGTLKTELRPQIFPFCIEVEELEDNLIHLSFRTGGQSPFELRRASGLLSHNHSSCSSVIVSSPSSAELMPSNGGLPIASIVCAISI